MSKPNPLLAEPLSLGQEATSRSTWCNSKFVLLFSLLTGFVLTVLFSQLSGSHGEVEETGIDMFGARLGNPSRLNFVSPMAASPMSMSCPRSGGMPISVSALEDNLKKHGIPSSPLTKFALTQFAATRDVSMAAQAKEEFLRLDPADQDMVKNLGREVVVRASAMKDMAGATAPLGFFDPLGFSEKGTSLAFLRSAELKHGRVCMLATLGFIVSEKFHPFFDAWGDGPYVSAVASHFAPTAVKNFWGAFLILCGAHEYYLEFSRSKTAAMEGSDFGWDPLGLTPSKPEDLKNMQNKELNNGRLAILASAGLVAQELVTGKKIF